MADGDTKATTIVQAAGPLPLDTLHAELRAVLLREFYQVPMDLLAAMLAYELVSIIATKAATKAMAVEAIKSFAANMTEQIRTHGVGHPHPVQGVPWTH